MTEISQMENKDEVRSICFADALQTDFGNWLAGLEMKFLRNQYRIGNSDARVTVIFFSRYQWPVTTNEPGSRGVNRLLISA